MTTYKMKSAQKGVLTGAVHPVVFEKGKTYELDDNLADEFKTLDAIEPSNEEPVVAVSTAPELHENWLDTDPAVLRHGELTAAQVIAKDESPLSDGQVPAVQVEGKAEGDQAPQPVNTDEPQDADGKGRKSK